MLRMAAARGANKLELFSNSPMWWMTASGNPSGVAPPYVLGNPATVSESIE